MAENVMILGAGGHAKVIADIVLARGDCLGGFLDDHAEGTVLGYPILGKISEILRYKDACSFIIGIGDNEARRKIAEQYSAGVRWYTAIHPAAVVALSVVMGGGTAVMAGAVINTSARIGRHCIVNTAAVVEHDNCMGDYVHISPHATLCGTVSVGELTHVGAGAIIKNNISVCPQSIIGAGAVVVRDITQPGTYVGVPVKRVK